MEFTSDELQVLLLALERGRDATTIYADHAANIRRAMGSDGTNRYAKEAEAMETLRAKMMAEYPDLKENLT